VIRVYLFRSRKDTISPVNDYVQACQWVDAQDWNVNVIRGTGPDGRVAFWVEFDTEEEAALFRLTHL
jgi:hypothetical protein